MDRFTDSVRILYSRFGESNVESRVRKFDRPPSPDMNAQRQAPVCTNVPMYMKSVPVGFVVAESTRSFRAELISIRASIIRVVLAEYHIISFQKLGFFEKAGDDDDMN